MNETSTAGYVGSDTVTVKDWGRPQVHIGLAKTTYRVKAGTTVDIIIEKGAKINIIAEGDQ